MYPELMNAPPRLSDLNGDDRTKALTARHRATTRNWLEGRAKRPLLERIFGAVA